MMVGQLDRTLQIGMGVYKFLRFPPLGEMGSQLVTPYLQRGSLSVRDIAQADS